MDIDFSCFPTIQESGSKAIWDWTQDTLIPGLYASDGYNGKQATWRERRYVADRQSFRVGPPRLRQLRIQPGRNAALATMVLQHTFP